MVSYTNGRISPHRTSHLYRKPFFNDPVLEREKIATNFNDILSRYLELSERPRYRNIAKTYFLSTTKDRGGLLSSSFFSFVCTSSRTPRMYETEDGKLVEVTKITSKHGFVNIITQKYSVSTLSMINVFVLSLLSPHLTFRTRSAIETLTRWPFIRSHVHD